MAAAMLSALLLPCVAHASTSGSASAGYPSELFVASRFELTRPGDGAWLSSFARGIVAKADALSAFGWIQVLRPEGLPPRIVGEARVPTPGGGAAFEAFLRAGPAEGGAQGAYAADILQYENGRIKLMFSDFRELVGSRRTCFASSPHACRAADAVEGAREAAAAVQPDAEEL